MSHVLPACDQDVRQNGKAVLMTHTFESEEIEDWVQLVAKESGQKVDWSWMGGRAVVRALGDLNKVYSAMGRNRHILFRSWYLKQWKQVRAEECMAIKKGYAHRIHLDYFPWRVYPVYP